MDAAAERAFEDLVLAMHKHWYRSAVLLTGDAHSAEDLVQQTMFKVFRSWNRVSSAENVRAYVNQMMVRTYLTGARRRWRRETASAECDPPALRDFSLAVDERDRLVRAMQELTAAQRTVIVLRFFEDMTLKDVARTASLPLSTVKSHCARGLRRLEAALGDE